MPLTRPAPGAPYDKRLTDAVLLQILASPPRAFNSATDVDLFDTLEAFIVERVTANVATQVEAGIEQGTTALTAANAGYVTQVQAIKGETATIRDQAATIRAETATIAADVEAAIIDAAATLYAPQAFVIEGLTYALPNAQPLDAPATASLTASLTSSRVSSGSTSADLTYVSRDLAYPFDPVRATPYVSLGATQRYRFGTAVNEQDSSAGAVNMTLTGSHGKVVRQEFAFSAPFTTDRILLKWSQHAGAAGYVEDCVYTIRLYGPGNALIKTWANVNLRGLVAPGTGETVHALDAETALTSGALELEVVSFYPTTNVGGGSTYYDINFYPLAATIPVSEQGTRPPATLVGTGTIKNAADEPLALASPVVRAAPKAVQASVFTVEGAAVRVHTGGQRLHTTLASLPRPAGKRRFVVIFTPQVRDVMLTTSLSLHLVTASIEQLQAGASLNRIAALDLTRPAGSPVFSLAGTPLAAGIRLRLEATVGLPAPDNTRPVTLDYYDDVSGVKLYTQTGSLLKGTTDAQQARLVLAPTLANSNIHAVDDLLIHRWTEWTEAP